MLVPNLTADREAARNDEYIILRRGQKTFNSYLSVWRRAKNLQFSEACNINKNYVRTQVAKCRTWALPTMSDVVIEHQNTLSALYQEHNVMKIQSHQKKYFFEILPLSVLRIHYEARVFDQR